MADKNRQPEFVAAQAWKLFVPLRGRQARHFRAVSDPDSRPRGPDVDYDAASALQDIQF